MKNPQTLYLLFLVSNLVLKHKNDFSRDLGTYLSTTPLLVTKQFMDCMVTMPGNLNLTLLSLSAIEINSFIPSFITLFDPIPSLPFFQTSLAIIFCSSFPNIT